ncbi:MAG: hypothetical protein K2W99_03990 [Chthoniobacterales bacterium]|nr:hypothetical protein [Chthoniobacterales bacterium]
MISESVQEFCSHHGLAKTTMTEGGGLKLAIADIGDFQLLHRSPYFLTGLSRKVENLYLLDARRVLGLCHFKRRSLKPLHAQLREDKLGFYYLFGEREITASLLSMALDSLTEAMDAAFQAL